MIDDLPTSLHDQAIMLEDILIDSATGGSSKDDTYQKLRRILIQDEATRSLIPSFVRSHRNLISFWGWIKAQRPTYAERRTLISEAFTPLIDYFEGRYQAPADQVATGVLTSINSDAVTTVWRKALERRASDPEGAITIARTLLEAVCKKILDDCYVEYDDKDDLPKLYGAAARQLKLAPDQHSEEPIRAILGGAMNTVNGIGTLRNRLSDAHGRGGKPPVRPLPRHASLAVNMSGTLATFLIETHLARQEAELKP